MQIGGVAAAKTPVTRRRRVHASTRKSSTRAYALAQDDTLVRRGRRPRRPDCNGALQSKATGISPLANTPTPYALQASLQTFGWGVRTRICALRTLTKRRDAVNAQIGSHVPAPKKRGPKNGGSSFLEQATGIEPAASAWEAEVLPLDYACDLFIISQSVCLVKSEAKILQPFSSTKFIQQTWGEKSYFSSSDSSVGNAFSNCAPYQCPSAVAFIAARVKLPATRAASSGVLPRTRAPVNADAKISPVP